MVKISFKFDIKLYFLKIFVWNEIKQKVDWNVIKLLINFIK